jgi:hypothetical protein
MNETIEAIRAIEAVQVVEAWVLANPLPAALIAASVPLLLGVGVYLLGRKRRAPAAEEEPAAEVTAAEE